jgi:glycosyltransferase involved in cell wall biosynthesis
VTVVEIAGRTQFELSEAKNAGIHAARTPWICLIDADVLLADGAADQMRRRLHPHHFLRCLTAWEGVGGTIVASRQALLQVGGHDPIYQGWGEEDDDLIDALLFIGERADALPQSWISHLHHDDALRTRFHEQSDRRQTQLCNRIYRAIKWDMAKIHGEVASLDRRRQLYASIRAQLEAALRTGSPAEITISLGEGRWSVLAARGTRALRYRVEFDEAAS